MKIFERWEVGESGFMQRTVRGVASEVCRDSPVIHWATLGERNPGEAFPNYGALYVCVADEPVYELRMEDGILRVAGEADKWGDQGCLAGDTAEETFPSLARWLSKARDWQKRFNIPVETTLRAVLDYYHAKFCRDSAGEVDGE